LFLGAQLGSIVSYHEFTNSDGLLDTVEGPFSPFIVQSLSSNAAVIRLVNNCGSFAYGYILADIEVIYGSDPTWSHTFDLTATNAGWFVDPHYGGYGSYVPGSGFVGSYLSVYYQPFGDFTLVGLSFVADNTSGSNSVGMGYVTHNTSPYPYVPHIWAGSPPLSGVSYALTSADEIIIAFNGEVVTLASITIRGTGTEPPW
jgi:hypothetical protein